MRQHGASREEALAHARDAILGWIETELEMGRTIPVETPAAITVGVAEVLAIIDAMRMAGEISADHGYELSIATVDVQPPLAA